MAPNPLQQRVQQQAYRIVFLQLLGVILLTIATYLLQTKEQSLSVLAGGLAYFIPNLVFVWMVFRYVKATQMIQFLTAFMLGEMFKLIISAILFIVIVNYLPVSLLSELIGFIGAIISFWVACFVYFSRQAAGNKRGTEGAV